VVGHHAYPNIGHRDPDLAHSPQLLREHRSVRWRALHSTQVSGAFPSLTRSILTDI
jgi:hypothetical protein